MNLKATVAVVVVGVVLLTIGEATKPEPTAAPAWSIVRTNGADRFVYMAQEVLADRERVAAILDTIVPAAGRVMVVIFDDEDTPMSFPMTARDERAWRAVYTRFPDLPDSVATKVGTEQFRWVSYNAASGRNEFEEDDIRPGYAGS